MSEWQNTTLTALGAFSSGKPIVPGQVGHYPAYGSNGVIGGSLESRYDQGIIIGRVGAYCGSVEVSKVPFWASDNTIVFEPRIQGDLDFLTYLLKSAKLNRHAGGAAQPLVTQGTLKALQFQVPGPAVRKRIGGVIRYFDDLIENNRRRVELLEQMARAIYREWFVHFRYPGHEDVSLVDSALDPIPQGWEVKRADSQITLQRGFDLPAKSRREGAVSVIGASGVQGTHDEVKVGGPGVTTGRSGTIGKVTYVQNDFWPLNTSL